jgi:hypothetical protein
MGSEAGLGKNAGKLQLSGAWRWHVAVKKTEGNSSFTCRMNKGNGKEGKDATENLRKGQREDGKRA